MTMIPVSSAESPLETAGSTPITMRVRSRYVFKVVAPGKAPKLRLAHLLTGLRRDWRPPSCRFADLAARLLGSLLPPMRGGHLGNRLGLLRHPRASLTHLPARLGTGRAPRLSLGSGGSCTHGRQLGGRSRTTATRQTQFLAMLRRERLADLRLPYLFNLLGRELAPPLPRANVGTMLGRQFPPRASYAELPTGLLVHLRRVAASPQVVATGNDRRERLDRSSLALVKLRLRIGLADDFDGPAVRSVFPNRSMQRRRLH